MSPLPHAVDEDGQPLDGGPLRDLTSVDVPERGDWTAEDRSSPFRAGPLTEAGRRASTVVKWSLLAALLAPLIVLLGGILRGIS